MSVRFGRLRWITLLLSCSAILTAQNFEGRRIVAVDYDPPHVLDAADLERVQVLKTGTALRPEDVSEAIDRLFATGEFADIRADAEASGDGVKIVFVTTPTRYIATLSVTGKVVDPPNRGELAKVPQLGVGDVFHDDDLKTAAAAMRKLLVSNGLYDGRVGPEIEMDPTGRQVFLKFVVHHGKRARYEMPEIHGDTKLPNNTIVRATGWRILFINRWRQVTESRTRNGLQGVAKKYQGAERLKARVELEELQYDAKSRRVLPKLSIDAGPKVQVVATEAKVSKRVMKRYVPVFEERAVDNDLLAEGARNLRDYFQSRGYFDTVVDYRIVPPKDDVERIEFAIAQGPRYKLVHVELVGNKYFREETLRERMFLEPATFYLRRGRYSEAFRKKDEENIANLYRANGFHDVKVTSEPLPDYKGKQGQIGVTVRIVEGPQWLVESVELQGVADGDRAEIESDLA